MSFEYIKKRYGFNHEIRSRFSLLAIVLKEIFKMRNFLCFCSFVLCFLFIGFLDAMFQKDVGRFISFLNIVISSFVALWVYSDIDKSDWGD